MATGVATLLGLLVLAYLLGSFPTGYLLCRFLGGFDIRDRGSGSTGATNVLRNLGKGPALVSLLVDAAKGSAAVLLLPWLWTQAELRLPGMLPGTLPGLDASVIVALGALAALLGHSCPVWLGFRGGKSVATSLGILLAMTWPIALGALGTFGLTIAISRIVSLSSILAAIAVGILMIATGQPLPYILFGVAGGLYVIWLHRANIQRLLAGTEPKIGKALPVETP